MRGYHDEMGGPDSIAQPSEWGSLGFGDGVTAAGLPASPGVAPSALPSDSPSEDTLRHNFLLRRHLNDPMYGVHDSDDWRQRTANGLGVPYVYSAPPPSETRLRRASCVPGSPFGI